MPDSLYNSINSRINDFQKRGIKGDVIAAEKGLKKIYNSFEEDSISLETDSFIYLKAKTLTYLIDLLVRKEKLKESKKYLDIFETVISGGKTDFKIRYFYCIVKSVHLFRCDKKNEAKNDLLLLLSNPELEEFPLFKGNIYFNLATMSKDDLKTTYDYTLKAFNSYSKINFEMGMNRCEGLFGYINKLKKNYDYSIVNYKKSLTIADKFHSISMSANMAEVLKAKSNQRAINYIDRAYDTADGLRLKSATQNLKNIEGSYIYEYKSKVKRYSTV